MHTYVFICRAHFKMRAHALLFSLFTRTHKPTADQGLCFVCACERSCRLRYEEIACGKKNKKHKHMRLNLLVHYSTVMKESL